MGPFEAIFGPKLNIVADQSKPPQEEQASKGYGLRIAVVLSGRTTSLRQIKAWALNDQK